MKKSKVIFALMLIAFVSIGQQMNAQSQDENVKPRIRRASPLIGSATETTPAVTITPEKHLAIAVKADYNMMGISQDINNMEDNYIYSDWSEVMGEHFSYGLDFKVRFSLNQESAWSNVWLIFGASYGNALFKSEKANNKMFKLNGDDVIIDHTIEYEIDYMSYLFGLTYTIPLNEHFSLNPRVNFNFLNPNIARITERDILEDETLMFSNGSISQSLERKEYTYRNILNVQLGADLEYQFNKDFSGLIGIYYNVPVDNMLESRAFSDRTGEINDMIELTNRTLTNYFSFSFMLQYKI